MAYTPTSTPACSRVTVGATEVAVTVPGQLKLGVLLLQRNADSDAVYYGFATGVLTTTGVLVSKGAPGSVAATLIPSEAFEAVKTIYLIGGASGQLVDVVMI